MKNMLAFLILLLPFMANAQKPSDLYGAWKFDRLDVSIPNKDDAKRTNAENMMKTMSIVFYPDNTYESAIINATERGKYRIDGDSITFYNTKDENSKPYSVKVVKSDPSHLTLAYSVNIILKRVPVSQDNIMLARQWELKAVMNTNEEDEDDMENSLPQPEGNIITFTADGTYSLALGHNSETGYWAAREGQENTILILNSDGKVKYWPIIRNDGKELVLELNDLGQQFIFSAR